MLLRYALCFGLALSLAAGVHAAEPNALSPDDKSAGFELLFNGTDLAGWKHGGNWKAADGAITREGKGGSLVYDVKNVPDDFELRFEWKVAPKSNSGVYYRPGQYEYQILDNALHADGKNPRTSAASGASCALATAGMNRADSAVRAAIRKALIGGSPWKKLGKESRRIRRQVRRNLRTRSSRYRH